MPGVYIISNTAGILSLAPLNIQIKIPVVIIDRIMKNVITCLIIFSRASISFMILFFNLTFINGKTNNKTLSRKVIILKFPCPREKLFQEPIAENKQDFEIPKQY
jgi:hypothetical protein